MHQWTESSFLELASTEETKLGFTYSWDLHPSGISPPLAVRLVELTGTGDAGDAFGAQVILEV